MHFDLVAEQLVPLHGQGKSPMAKQPPPVRLVAGLRHIYHYQDMNNKVAK